MTSDDLAYSLSLNIKRSEHQSEAGKEPRSPDRTTHGQKQSQIWFFCPFCQWGRADMNRNRFRKGRVSTDKLMTRLNNNTKETLQVVRGWHCSLHTPLKASWSHRHIYSKPGLCDVDNELNVICLQPGVQWLFSCAKMQKQCWTPTSSVAIEASRSIQPKTSRSSAGSRPWQTKCSESGPLDLNATAAS